jgi:hypothetical protein
LTIIPDLNNDKKEITGIEGIGKKIDLVEN